VLDGVAGERAWQIMRAASWDVTQLKEQGCTAVSMTWRAMTVMPYNP